jgi:hypothetical protein
MYWYVSHVKKNKIEKMGENTFRRGGGGGIVVTLYYFLGVPCLNFNHVIIMKDFHNVFPYYNSLNSKEIKI